MENIEIKNKTVDESLPVIEKNPTSIQPQKSKKKTCVFVLVAIVCCIAILGFYQVNKEKPLTGNDKIAYDLILNASYNFKDPSSVRVVSGMVTEDAGSFVLSATNGFGARGTKYYLITEDVVLNLDDEDDIMNLLLFAGNQAKLSAAKSACEMRDQLDVKSINKALEKYWS